MKRKILLGNRYEGALYDLLRKVIADRFDFQMLDVVSQEDLAEKIKDADYLLSSGRLQIDESVLKYAEKLKMIQRTGVGLDCIDLDAVKNHGVPLYVNPGVNAQSVAEYTLMLMLMCLKNSIAVSGSMTKGEWKKQKFGISNHELYKKTVGIIGMGNIGKRVAKMLKSFDCEILYYDSFRLSKEDETKLGVRYCDLEVLFSSSDILSLHCPYDKKTGAIISAEQIKMMKDGVIIINTARGKLIKQEDLILALQSGKILFCGLDTYEEEPLCGDNELRKMNNVILSPHIAGLSYESYDRMFSGAIDNIVKFDRDLKEEIAECLAV